MRDRGEAERGARTRPVWVSPLGGPLVVVSRSSVNGWGGRSGEGALLGGAGGRDDYDRACEVEGWAGVIGTGTATALVLADEPG